MTTDRDKAREIVVMSVRLESGAFEASLSVPLRDDMTTEEFKTHVSDWLALSLTALRHGVENMQATLDRDTIGGAP